MNTLYVHLLFYFGIFFMSILHGQSNQPYIARLLISIDKFYFLHLLAKSTAWIKDPDPSVRTELKISLVISKITLKTTSILGSQNNISD